MTQARVEKIKNWLQEYSSTSQTQGFVVGVSGGIDSALTSVLCAQTGLPVVVVGMSIYQAPDQVNRSEQHMDWLVETFENVSKFSFDLTNTFKAFISDTGCENELALANTRSRLRMTCLYSLANTRNMLVAGTGNKVEDYGIGFFTKYGDGGVDLSPIADLLKSEVREMAQFLGVSADIVHASPTDGLWNDNRTDEDQIGATYAELEWALNYHDTQGEVYEGLSQRQVEVLKLYLHRHATSAHKLEAPPVCYL